MFSNKIIKMNLKNRICLNEDTVFLCLAFVQRNCKKIIEKEISIYYRDYEEFLTICNRDTEF